MTMQANLSPSVNIVRDAERPFRYIKTANSNFVFEQIITAFKSGIRTFSIIGSYGTGKSAFLLALMQYFNNPLKNDIFQATNGEFNGLNQFETISIVGENRSLVTVMSERLGVLTERKAIFSALKTKHLALQQEKKCYIILIDEFGKFLEYAAQNNPITELYFLQELAEFINDPDKNFLFLTTLHQNFDAYSLGEAEKKEWEKVKGRFKELTFNEPVEQLLHIASEFIVAQQTIPQHFDTELLHAIMGANVFRVQVQLSGHFAQRLYPLDILAAMSLTVALQRYGQNERSLFSFLTTDEHLGLAYYYKNQNSNSYLHLAWVYDYLIFNFHSSLTSKSNNDFFKWVTLRKTIERVYSRFTNNVEDLLKLVKTIGLIEILGSDGAMVDIHFLKTYGATALGIKQAETLVRELEISKIIIYQSFKKRFKLFEGTDENLDILIKNELLKVQLHESLIPELTNYITEKYHVAKAFTYKTGTPRVFEVKISNEPIKSFQEKNNEIDGFVNLIFSNQNFNFKELSENEPIIYGVYHNFDTLKENIKEIQATKQAISYVTAKNDTVAKEELEIWDSFHVKKLNHTIQVQLFSKNGNVSWFWKGEEIMINDKKVFNQTLSKICDTIYHATPQYRNELINRASYSNNISKARKDFLAALYEQPYETNFGFDNDLMPPEKMIYLTLCKQTQLFDTSGETFLCQEPSGNSTFKQLWDVSINFLASTQTGKRPLSELIDVLYKKPFRLKNGLIDFWILAFLRGHREEIAIFKNGIYIPKVGQDVAELFFKEAKNFEIKQFNIQGVRLHLFNKYRELTKQSQQGNISTTNFQETAKPFVVFYNKLPKYTQQTKSVSQDCIAFVKAISSAKDLEKLFFEDLPIIFGTNIDRLSESEIYLNDFVNRINTSIAELRQAYDNLIERIEYNLLAILGLEKIDFTTYQKDIQKRYANIKEHLLFPRQKSFLNRLKLPLDDRNAWINSIVQVLCNKQLVDFSDEEEIILYDRLAAAFKELDDLLLLNVMDFNTDNQQAMTIEITGSDNLKVKKNVILNKQQQEEINNFEKKINKVLKDASPNVYQAVLIQLLKNTINDKN